MLDPGAYGTVLITKSITINGTPGTGHGSMLAQQGINGIIINMNAADPFKTVRLNWLDIAFTARTAKTGRSNPARASTGVSTIRSPSLCTTNYSSRALDPQPPHARAEAHGGQVTVVCGYSTGAGIRATDMRGCAS